VPDSTKLRVGGLTPLTSIDYPGELAAVVYCQGCPWRCRYCHNPGLLPGGSENELDWEHVLAFLKRRKGLLDAVVFSGGEPTLQAALPEAVDRAKAMGYKVGLHSAGIYPDRLERVLPLVDWVGLDIKAPKERYSEITGIPDSGEAAWESARRLTSSGTDHEIRITVHPSILLPKTAMAVATALETMGALKVVIQSCRTEHALDPSLHTLPPVELSAYSAISATLRGVDGS
jgi:pyruvate formate lyase activating enzyme